VKKRKVCFWLARSRAPKGKKLQFEGKIGWRVLAFGKPFSAWRYAYEKIRTDFERNLNQN